MTIDHSGRGLRNEIGQIRRRDIIQIDITTNDTLRHCISGVRTILPIGYIISIARPTSHPL